MSDPGLETPLDAESLRSRRGLWRPVLLIIAVVVVLVVGLSRWWLPLWTGSVLQRAALRHGIQLDRVQVDLTPIGGRLGNLEGSTRESTFSIEEATITWSLADIARGRLEDVTLEGLEATIDVSRLWPMPVHAENWGQRPERAAEVPSPAPERAQVTPTSRGREISVKDEDPVPQRIRESWLTGLPMDGLFVPSARITARYGESLLPLTAQVAYTAEDFRREAWIQVTGRDLDFQVSAREVGDEVNWTAQGKLRWEEPLSVLREFFPLEHPANPRTWQSRGANSVEVNDVSAEGVVRGHGESWEEMGLLLEGSAAAIVWSETGAIELSDWIVALRGAPDALDWSAGFAIESAREGPWSAQPFQLKLERDAGGAVRAETPLLRWKHAGGISGEMTARFFAEWPSGRDVPSVEAQIAFSEMALPAFAFRPFRFFLNLRDGTFDGRMSTLELSADARWGLVGTELEGSWTTGEWEMEIETALEFVPRTEVVARLTGLARSTEKGAPFMTEGIVQLPDGPVAATWQGVFQADGHATLRFAESWRLGDIVPALAAIWPRLASWESAGEIEWWAELEGRDAGSFESRLYASLHEVDLGDASAGWAATGISGEIRLEARPFPRSLGSQKLTMGSLEAESLHLSEVDLRVNWPVLSRLRVENLVAKWLGGEIEVDPFYFNPQAPEFSTVVRFFNADASRVRRFFPSIPEGARGRVEGSWEVAYRNGKWIVGDASVLLKEEGEIVWRDDRASPAAL